MKTVITLMKNIKVNFIALVLLILLSINFQSCDEETTFALSEQEIAEGLKEALIVGTNYSVEETNQHNGFYDNPAYPGIKIPWPEEATGAYNYIDENMDLIKPLLDTVVLRMNRAAEQASNKAKPIFIDAITGITIQDARDILNGTNDEATNYLKDRTYNELHAEFRGDIYCALENVKAVTAWETITTKYNRIASFTFGQEPINTDLADYTTEKTLDGLFHLVAEEEMKIRTDPKARVNDLLERVFGELD